MIKVIYDGGFPILGWKSSCSDFCAYHYSFNDPTWGQIVYAVFPDTRTQGCSTQCGGGSSPTCTDLQSMIVSHEIAEACSDPLGNQPGKVGWNSPQGENGDVCSGRLGYVDGLPVQYIYSRLDNACITSKDFDLTSTSLNLVFAKNRYPITVNFTVAQKGNSTQLITLSNYVIPDKFITSFTPNSTNHGIVSLRITYSGQGNEHNSFTLTIQGVGALYKKYITYTITFQN